MSMLEKFKDDQRRCAELVSDGMYEEALICAHKTLDVYEENELTEEIDNVFNGLTLVVYNIEKSTLYMTYLDRLIAIFIRQGCITKQVDAMYELGFSYAKGDEFEKAEQLFNDVVSIASNANYYSGQANGINGLGINQLLQKNYEKALDFFKEAYNFSLEFKCENGKRFAHNIGYVLKCVGNYDEALKYFKQAYDYSLSVESYDQLANRANEVGDTYRRNGDYELAKEYLAKGLEYSLKAKNYYYVSENYQFQTELYAEFGLYKEAFEATRKHYEMDASINKLKHSFSIEQLRYQLEVKHKEEENQIIKTKNLELESYSQELSRMNNELEKALYETHQMQKEVIRSEKEAAFNRMLVAIAHTMNTAIGNINMVTTNLKELIDVTESKFEKKLLKKDDLKDLFDTCKESFMIIGSSSDKMSLFINKLKKVSISIEEMSSKSSISEIVEKCIEKCKKEIKESSCKINIDIEPEIRPLKGALIYQQVFAQLFDNVFRYAFKVKGEYQIDIKAYYDKGALVILFKDNGMGIDEISVQFIFDPFFTSNMGSVGGSGLGLYITYKAITEVMGGTIKCNSTLGEGTIFTITIPDECES